MITTTPVVSERVTEILGQIRLFTPSERLVLAKYLLDSLVDSEETDEVDWRELGLSAFEKDWDNPEDAIYDNWRDLYGVSAR